MLYKVVPTFESVDEIVSVTIPIKAAEQYFPVHVVLFGFNVSQVEILICLICGTLVI